MKGEILASREEQIRKFYKVLFATWGRQHWWPARSRFEVIVGAYLTQNTAWTNVEKALRNLRRARRLSVAGVRTVGVRELEALVRPAGFFRQKARSLKTFAAYLDLRYGGSLERMFARPTGELREELLALKGVGPETADSILLYAGNHPVFVVDAYTRRLLDRHGLLRAKAEYEEIRELFEGALAGMEAGVPARKGGKGAWGAWHPPSRMSSMERPRLVQIYNELHGLIVGVGKNYCLRTNPRCEQCPLGRFLPPTKLAPKR